MLPQSPTMVNIVCEEILELQNYLERLSAGTVCI